ncbi:BspA family leucine-rich repeat surface protein [Lactobacillus mellis]|nr:BspA family leucine-rich repeat surface protein [Bombilactobacillus mellis]
MCGDVFLLCSLTSLDLSSFKTEKVTDMSNMFQEDLKLKKLDLSNFTHLI